MKTIDEFCRGNERLYNYNKLFSVSIKFNTLKIIIEKL